MLQLDNLDTLFVIVAFLIQILLVVFFAYKKWNFEKALQLGIGIYALSLLATFVSILHLLNGKPWYTWLTGAVYTAWAVFGYLVDQELKIEWRNPIRPSIFIPYVVLYIGSLVLYWWGVGLLYRPLWYVYAVLFVISTVLNITSHKPTGQQIKRLS